jgi:hypothetical protein
MPIDISHLSVPNEMKHQIRTLFYNYTDVFSKNGDDVGYTDTIKHRIRFRTRTMGDAYGLVHVLSLMILFSINFLI